MRTAINEKAWTVTTAFERKTTARLPQKIKYKRLQCNPKHPSKSTEVNIIITTF